MAGVIVIAAYRAESDKQESLQAIVRRKREFMMSQGYYTSRTPIIMKSETDPDILIEVFEWTGKEAIEKAHGDERVLKIWNEMDELCYEIGSTLGSFREADESFPGFLPVSL